jgi:hypothetical protein
MTPSRRWLLPALCVAWIAWARSYPLVADDQALSQGRAEFQRAVETLRPRPSLDTTPVEFSVGGIHYRMPRNYLTTMGNWSGGPQPLVTVTVNIPDLKPLSPDTLICFTEKPAIRPPGCEPFSFDIEATGMVSADEAFANMRRLFHSQEPIEGPFGYEKYEIGPENSRIEYYKKAMEGRTLLFTCQIFDNHNKRDGICTPVGDRVSTGGTLHFFFNLRHLADIGEIDANLRKLTERFTVQPGDEK